MFQGIADFLQSCLDRQLEEDIGQTALLTEVGAPRPVPYVLHTASTTCEVPGNERFNLPHRFTVNTS